jgi:hypothetical protein
MDLEVRFQSIENRLNQLEEHFKRFFGIPKYNEPIGPIDKSAYKFTNSPNYSNGNPDNTNSYQPIELTEPNPIYTNPYILDDNLFDDL